MSRSSWKPFVIHNILLRAIKARVTGSGKRFGIENNKNARLTIRQQRALPKRLILKKIRDSIIPIGFSGVLKIYRGTIWDVRYRQYTANKQIEESETFLGRRFGEFSFTKRVGRTMHRFNKTAIKSLKKKRQLIRTSEARASRKKLSKKEQGRVHAKIKAKK